MGILAGVLALALSAAPSAADDATRDMPVAASDLPRDMPTSEADFYLAGQDFARCGGHLAFAAEIARGQNMPANATAFENNERAWRIAGLVLLASGVDPARQSNVEQLFDDMEAGKVAQLLAWRESDPDGYGERMTSQFRDDCLPWVPVQNAIIAALRGAAAPR